MGDPSMQGMPAGSDAQHGEKSFPPDTGADIPVTSGLPHDPVLIGSPVFPEIRQVTAPGDMGEGYREAGEGDPS